MNIRDDLELEYPSPSRRRWGKRFLWSGLSFLLVLMIGGIVRLKWNEHAAQNELSAVIAELDAIDPLWRLDDIEAARKVIPDDENTALIVMQAASALPKPFPSMPATAGGVPDPSYHLQNRLGEAPTAELLDPQLYWELRAELAKAQPALDKARSLSEFRHGRFPITLSKDFIGTLLPGVQEAREIVNLLQLDALARCRENDIEGALLSCRALLIAAQSTGDEPLIICQLIRMACLGVGQRSLEGTLAQGQASEKTLVRLQKLLEEEEAEPIMIIAARGERAGEHMLMQGLGDGTVSLSQLTASFGGTANGLRATLDRFAAGYAARQAHAVLLRKTTEFIEILKLPPEQRIDLLKDFEKAIKIEAPDMPTLARLLLPAMTKVASSDIRVRAVLRCAIAALAAERFRLASKRWPKNLDELVPTYLKQVPVDPYDGKPLRFRVVEDGVAIYSIGPDRQDDGGKVDREKPLGPGSDLVFRLWNMDARRQPARNPDVGPPRPTREDLERMEMERMQQEWQVPPPEKPKVP